VDRGDVDREVVVGQVVVGQVLVRCRLVREVLVHRRLERQQLDRQVVVREVLVVGRVGRAMTAGVQTDAPLGTAPPRTLRVGAVLVVMAVAGSLLPVVAVAVASPSGRTTQLASAVALTLLVGFALAELAVVHIPVGRNNYTLSLSDIPLVVGLFLLGPAAYLVVRVLGAAVPLALRNRRSPRKLVFNLAWYSTEASVAVLLWHLLAADGRDPSPVTWVAAGAVTVAVDLLGTALISVVMAADSGARPSLREVLAETTPVVALVNASSALVIVYVVTVDWRALWTVGVVVAVIWYAQRSHNRLRRRTESLEQLTTFTGEVGGQLDVDAAATTALVWMTKALKAEVVELTLTSAFAGADRRWVARYDGSVTELPGAGLASGIRPWLTSGPALVRRGTRDHAQAQALRDAGLRDAAAMSLTGDGELIGTLLVGDRLGDVESFSGSDLRELVALGNHLSLTLRNARRADAIREQAEDQLRRSLCDELTGLPNRRGLEQQLASVLASGRGATVVVLDLDRFKDINDTLGHRTGDGLLKMVADRLAASIPDDATVARLAADEFAVLIARSEEVATAPAVAMIRDAFARPYQLDDLQVTVEASLGVASTSATSEPTDMLRQADIAMFAAKARRTGVEVYRAELEVGGPARLTVLTDLRAALTRGELVVHFQPKVSLRDGTVLGAEALVRWHHPTRGFIRPDDFIPVAEHSGLITPLTFAVLRQALDACAGWRRSGRRIGVAVNISPRSLLDPAFVDEVARAIAAVEVPASAVTLEITESSLMDDPERSVAALHRLRSLGVHLSIDDLGTGYSSLAYLQRLPATEVKIDKSFLQGGPDDHEAVTVVGAVVDLGHRLGRVVVAEGVEDEETWRMLQRLGCDSAQGFWLARPLPAADFETWLAAHRAAPLAALRSVG
jgi:diguanylate cyclase (GGDEF)-like protein